MDSSSHFGKRYGNYLDVSCIFLFPFIPKYIHRLRLVATTWYMPFLSTILATHYGIPIYKITCIATQLYSINIYIYKLFTFCSMLCHVFQHNYNQAIYKFTGYSHVEACYGYQPLAPFELPITLPPSTSKHKKCEQYKSSTFVQNIPHIHAHVTRDLTTSQACYKPSRIVTTSLLSFISLTGLCYT